ncbi:MAG: hypothetical protein C5B52_05385 [Bacteroidetes bacterium]|nr:MAG: hypothetical protein C5B52_05385 [Bacteroidota bacterium]
MRKYFLIFTIASMAFSCLENSNSNNDEIFAGQMPNLVKDSKGNVHLVYGSGDSIFYNYSLDNGRSFSPPILVGILPKLAASHMRGPQIAAGSNGVIITACNNIGNIFSYSKDQSGNWSEPVRVNDIDSIAKENLMALSANSNNAFAVWLDLRDGHNRIYGAKSTDGGKSWSKNILVYASPDTTVCECCKPSVIVNGNNVFVMFRNWLNGNRDLYLVQSKDGGNIFGQAQKLGTGSWPLNGCPMDGGGLAINDKDIPETVWNRKGVIYACELGKEEKKLGEGRNCTIELVNGKNVYAWVEDGNVVVLKPQGIKSKLGKGQLPVLKGVDKEHVLCIWENDKKIHKAIIEI